MLVPDMTLGRLGVVRGIGKTAAEGAKHCRGRWRSERAVLNWGIYGRLSYAFLPSPVLHSPSTDRTCPCPPCMAQSLGKVASLEPDFRCMICMTKMRSITIQAVTALQQSKLVQSKRRSLCKLHTTRPELPVPEPAAASTIFIAVLEIVEHQSSIGGETLRSRPRRTAGVLTLRSATGSSCWSTAI